MHEPSAPHSRGGKPSRTSLNNSSLLLASSMPTDLTAKQPAVFYSCLDIPVEGATPIRDNDAPHPKTLPQSSTEPRRAPRKSKTDALVAMQIQARTTGDHQEIVYDENQTRTYAKGGPPIPVSPRLDLSTVKTVSPRNPPPRTQPRPFGLQECPTFYPSTEEFKDPIGYIRSISDHAKDFGICKVVPPVGWKMPFVTDTETFRFKTRLQCLNSIEASSRAKLNFLEQLYRFHKQQGNPRVSVPTINHKPLDLWLLRKEVHRLGGYEAVTKGKKWADLGRLLGFSGIPGLSTQIKNSYTRVILPYEHFCERVRSNPSISALPFRGDRRSTPDLNRQSTSGTSMTLMSTRGSSNFDTSNSSVSSNSELAAKLKAKRGGSEQSTPPSSPLTSTSSPLSEPPDEGDLKDMDVDGLFAFGTEIKDSETDAVGNGLLSSELARLSSGQAKNKNGNGTTTPETQCEVCHKKNRGEEMLLCDGCDCGFHMFCLDPPLTTIPKGQWFCHTCIFGTGGDYGFDEGEEHSLSSFQARDREFRKMWFTTHPPEAHSDDSPTTRISKDVVVSEDVVENEFWRLVSSQRETVEVEYGADVHSTTHGSAMPTLETHPLNPYAKDPWNLNNMPILSDSLLRFIKSDISGMTVPWTYVGMIFSTFCWHNEDHYTYSINFMHWGETKTWYGVPGDDATLFEAAIRREAPDLFEAQPDLLFQLVTLMNPNRLTEAGVRVAACNQRAGEFVITYPKAYHAGFNHGLNFNEAVNFAPADWLPFGRDCVRRYQEHGKLPVFSHDELLITVTQQSHSIKTALWLNNSFKEMIDRELAIRKKVKTFKFGEVLEEEDRPSEEQYQCIICKVFLYLSQVTCQCTTRVACIEHADRLCKCPIPTRALRKRFSDEELLETYAKVADRASVPDAWRTKLSNLLSEGPRPQLRALRSILAEGERISHPMSELQVLRKCVSRANEWVDAANSFVVRKPNRKRTRKSRSGKSVTDPGANGIDESYDRPERGLEDVYALLREVENLGFDCPEIAVLRNLTSEAENLKVKARQLLATPEEQRERPGFIQECEALMLNGSSLNIYLAELFEVEQIFLREQLIKELDESEPSMLLDDVRHLVARARTCKLPDDSKYMKILDAKQAAGSSWEDKAKSLIAQRIKSIEDLEEFAQTESDVPVNSILLDRILGLHSKAREYQKQADAMLQYEPGAPKSRPQDAMKLVTRAERDYNIPSINDLRRTTDFALDLESRCELVLKGSYQHLESEGDIFTMFHQWKDYAKEHLVMFTMPHFEKFEKQLGDHYRWLERLPWYCRQHGHPHDKPIVDDVLEATRAGDDTPSNDEYLSCICTTPVRPPAPGGVSDAVQCDHCFARFHGVCAANGGSCPFCDHHHWNGTIHKDRNWHYAYLFEMATDVPDVTRGYSEHWKQVETIIYRVDRLVTHIGQFLNFASQPANQRPELLPRVRHYMRKLFKIQFVVGHEKEVSYGLDLAGLHRLLATQPPAPKPRKKKRPRLTFGQDYDKDWLDGTRCICRGRTDYLINYPKVHCELCQRYYHGGCVFYPIDHANTEKNTFTCPLCCLRKNKTYPYSDVRVRHMDKPDMDIYVDTEQMLNTSCKSIVFKKLPRPYTQTLFVELVKFTPGEHNSSHDPTSRSQSVLEDKPHHRSLPPSSPHQSPDQNRHIPPPPPWSSRWSNAATAASPPTGAPSGSVHDSPLLLPSPMRPRGLSDPRLMPTPPPSRKRKYDEASSVGEDRILPSPAILQRSPKRRVTQPQPPVASSSGSQPAARLPTLSPSLALIMSPTSAEPRGSPRQPRPPSSSYSLSASTSAPQPVPRLPPLSPPSPPQRYRNS